MMGSERLAGLAASLYTLALLATLPVLIAVLLSLLLRRSRAEGRVMVWRSAVIALAALVAARALPVPTISWSVPALLAAPLVALGRMQVVDASNGGTVGTMVLSGGGALFTLQTLFVVYVAGVCAVLLPTVAGVLRARAMARNARPAGEAWYSLMPDVRALPGCRNAITIRESAFVNVPVTWGWRSPVIMVPCAASAWSASQRRTVLMHELQHIGAGDWSFGLLARTVCALLWFHPGVWWVARSLHDDCELACDARVIAAGVRRSDYAELLLVASRDACSAAISGTLALGRRRGLRARLHAVLDRRREVAPLQRRWRLVAASCTLLVAAPVSVAQLAPTRAVLTTLLGDSRWESRAYAVVGLAQRPDTVAVARAAAARDPNPRVRAWARRALAEPRG
jgi:beta-lactamase regulating signal transducer with metallopeptidase domain